MWEEQLKAPIPGQETVTSSATAQDEMRDFMQFMGQAR